MAGFGLLGAMSGWAAAACLILLVSSFAVGLPGRARAGEPAVPLRPLVSFFVSVSIYLVLLNLIMVADQLLLAALSAKWFAAHGDDALATLRASMTDGFLPDFTSIAPAAAADGQVGYYRAVQTLARLSYQAIIAATFVVFPLVSRSTFENDRAATARYVHTTTRYSLVFASAIAVVLAANPAEMLDLPFPSDYASTGWAALVALALGNVAFSVFAIVGTILNGAGFTREAIAVAGATLVVAAVANALVIPRLVPGQALLTACATATALSMLLGAAAGGLLIKRKVGAFLPLASLVRVALAAAAAIGFGRLVSLGGAVGTLVEAAAVGLVFLVVLIATREFRRADLDALRRVLRRRKGGNS
jgi:stage V sporulation protein B